MTERRLSTDRACWMALGAALVAAAALILWLDRATTYNVDQMRFLLAGPELDLGGLLEPQNGNLLLTTTVAYKLLLEAFGADFLAFRIIHVVVVLIAATLFYALVKRRIGPIAALAPTVVLLCFGSDWWHVGTALGFTVVSSVAAGLGALLLLERRDRVGDLGACVLLAVSVASFSTGLAFVVGVAISVLIRSDRWRRAWIWALPLALYLAWWLWARGGDSPSQDPELSNLLLVPNYAFTSLAAVLGSLSGLNYEFPPQIPLNLIAIGPGAVLAVLALALLAIRIRRGNVPGPVWVGLGIVLAYWTLGALVAETGLGVRAPIKTRYMYPGAVMVLLVAAWALSGTKFSRRALIAVLALAAVSVATNLALMRDGTDWLRNEYSASARAQFAMLDLARERVSPAYDPQLFYGDVALVSTPAGEYLAAAAEFGSPGFTLTELARQTEEVRAGADRILAGAFGIRVEPSASPAHGLDRCRRLPSSAGEVAFELPLEGAVVRMRSPTAADVSLGRFSDSAPYPAGRLEPGVPATLAVPADASSTPWRVLVASPAAIQVCGETAQGPSS
jgi:hypothetical protein